MSTILIVEDEKGIRANLEEILENEGFDVLSASNGKEGLYLAIEEKPDLILADIIMPRMDGYEMMEKLKAKNDTAKIPFIFLTSKTKQEDIRKGMELGAEEYLVKPFKIDDVVNTIKEKLTRKDLTKRIKSTYLTNEPTQLKNDRRKNK